MYALAIMSAGYYIFAASSGIVDEKYAENIVWKWESFKGTTDKVGCRFELLYWLLFIAVNSMHADKE